MVDVPAGPKLRKSPDAGAAAIPAEPGLCDDYDSRRLSDRFTSVAEIGNRPIWDEPRWPHMRIPDVMRIRGRLRGLIVVGPLILAACGTAKASDQSNAAQPQPAKSAMPSMDMNMHGDMPEMSMPGKSSPAAAAEGTPSTTSQMVCSTEIRKDVATLLGMPALPHVVSSWKDHRYTCTYHLANGPLQISVQELASKSAAVAYLNTIRAKYADAHRLTGVASFGLPGFQAASGAVAFAKDDKTLLVDPTALPTTVGQGGRSEFGYTVASDIIGCWNGD